MKITPALFTQTTPAVRPAREASQARMAFEAMLSAGASRTVLTRDPENKVPAQTSSSTGEVTNNDSAEAPFQRPGRVLDIRV